MRMLRDDGIEFLLHLQDLTSLNFDIRSLTLNTTQWLVNHHTAMWQGRTLAFLTRNEQYGSHGSSHTCTNGSYITGNKLHGIIDTQTGSNATARTVQIDGNILAAIYRVEIEQLCLQGVGCIIINFCTQENDTVHHQTREHIHLGNVQLTLLQDIRVQILSLRLHHVVKHHPIHTKMLGSIFSKIVHIYITFFFKIRNKKRGYRPHYLIRWNKDNKKSR